MNKQPEVVTKFCRTCNARDRIIINGRCVICRCRPEAEAVDEQSNA